MTIKLNKNYDLFVDLLKHIYQYRKKNPKLGEGQWPGEMFENDYLGFKKADGMSCDLIDTIGRNLDYLWFGRERVTERGWVEMVLEDDALYSFYDEFVCKNQKLFVDDPAAAW